MLSALKQAIQSLIGLTGFQITRRQASGFRPDALPSHLQSQLPPGAAQALRGDNPRLLELRSRYAASGHPAAANSHWNSGFVVENVNLLNFRGDNAYLWQVRTAQQTAELCYFINTLYAERNDSAQMLSKLDEDGAFGCFTFTYDGRKPVSRDLLDSVNEINFLDQHTGLCSQPGLRMLDIGAGYGRLAHRVSAALPNLESYVCVDAVPESTFLCEYYLAFRGIPTSRARAVPLDEVETLTQEAPFHVAVNIHSFTECHYAAIQFWIGLVARLNVRWLLIAPNKTTLSGHDLLSIEADGTKKDFSGLISDAGYRLVLRTPKYNDAHIHNRMAGLAGFAGAEYYLYEKVS